MHVRKVKSRNSLCFQIGRKKAGKFCLIKHIGCAPITSEVKIEALRLKAQAELTELLFKQQLSLFPSYEVKMEDKKLIVAFNETRARRDKLKGEKQIGKLQQALLSGKSVVRKSKYLLLEGKRRAIGIDQEQIEKDQRFDGLKGYFTNTDNKMERSEIIQQYRNLWQIEKAFRMSKSDLKERPVYHWKEKRIHAHLILCFVSLLVMKESETILKRAGFSVEQTIQVLGKVGQGKIKLHNVVLEIDSELTQKAKSILKLFSGH